MGKFVVFFILATVLQVFCLLALPVVLCIELGKSLKDWYESVAYRIANMHYLAYRSQSWSELIYKDYFKTVRRIYNERYKK